MHRYGPALCLIGVAQAALGPLYGLPPAATALLLWSGASFAGVGIAYLAPRTLGPGVFGKRLDTGALPTGRLALLLPYLLITWGLWHLRAALSREAVRNEIAPGLHLGRRPRNLRELPPGTALVLDLTAEFPATPGTLAHDLSYRCLPTLDAAAPETALWRERVKEAAEMVRAGQTVYIHCALGHGRSGLTTAAVLWSLGLAQDADDALMRVRTMRPGVALAAEQKRLLEELCTAKTGEAAGIASRT